MTFPHYSQAQPLASSSFQTSFQPLPYSCDPQRNFSVSQGSAQGIFQQPDFTNNMNDHVISDLKTRIAILETELRFERDSKVVIQQNCDFLIHQLRLGDSSIAPRNDRLEPTLQKAVVKRNKSTQCSFSTVGSPDLLAFDDSGDNSTLTSFTTLSLSGIPKSAPLTDEEGPLWNSDTPNRRSVAQVQHEDGSANKSFWEKNKPDLPPPVWTGKNADSTQYQQEDDELNNTLPPPVWKGKKDAQHQQQDRQPDIYAQSPRPDHSTVSPTKHDLIDADVPNDPPVNDTNNPLDTSRYAVQPSHTAARPTLCHDDSATSQPNNRFPRPNTFTSSPKRQDMTVSSNRFFRNTRAMPNPSRHTARPSHTIPRPLLRYDDYDAVCGPLTPTPSILPYDDEDATTPVPLLSREEDIARTQALVCYKPAVNASNVYRTVLVTGLVADTSVSSVLAGIRGWAVVAVRRMATAKAFGSDSMMVTFLQETGARRFLRSIHASSQTTAIAGVESKLKTEEKTPDKPALENIDEKDGKGQKERLHYALLPTPTFPLSEELSHLIYRQNFTRCVVLTIRQHSGTRPSLSEIRQELSRSVTGYDARSIIRIGFEDDDSDTQDGEDNKDDDNGSEDGEIRDGNSDTATNNPSSITPAKELFPMIVHVEFSSVSAVQRALNCLDTSTAKWAGYCSVAFEREGCDRAVSEGSVAFPAFPAAVADGGDGGDGGNGGFVGGEDGGVAGRGLPEERDCAKVETLDVETDLLIPERSTEGENEKTQLIVEDKEAVPVIDITPAIPARNNETCTNDKTAATTVPAEANYITETLPKHHDPQTIVFNPLIYDEPPKFGRLPRRNVEERRWFNARHRDDVMPTEECPLDY